MKPLSAVVAQVDSRTAEALAATLHNHFRSVSVARSLEELRNAIPRQRADVIIVDLELVALPEIENLHREFNSTTIVCTHRVADEEIWTSALSVGATDVCSSDDLGGIVTSALRSVSPVDQQAA